MSGIGWEPSTVGARVVLEQRPGQWQIYSREKVMNKEPLID